MSPSDPPLPLDGLQARADDPARNYCLWDYPRPAPVPAQGGLRSEALLWLALQAAGLSPQDLLRWQRLVQGLQQALGRFATVYGVKWQPVQGSHSGVGAGAWAWELYVYDYARQRRTASATRLLDLLQSLGVRCEVEVNEALPYFMASVDIDAALLRGERALEVVHLYLGNPGSALSSGISYAATGRGPQARRTLENLYFFFDGGSAEGRAATARKIQASAQVDFERVPLDQAWPPELRACRSTCVAHKSGHDCVYASGIGIDQLLWFLRRHGHAPALVQAVLHRREALSHLLFDVGADYAERDGRLQVLKTGWYGVF